MGTEVKRGHCHNHPLQLYFFWLFPTDFHHALNFQAVWYEIGYENLVQWGYLTKFHSRCVQSQSSKSAGSEWTQRHQWNQCTSMLKIINSKKCYGNDTNPELGKSNNNIKCDKKCKPDQAFVVHFQELSVLIKFKLIFFIILLYST